MDPWSIHMITWYKLQKRCLILVGFNFLDKNYKPGPLLYSFIIASFFYGLFSIYTMIVSDLELKLQCLSLFGFCLQGVGKFHVALTKGPLLCKMIIFLNKVVQVNSRTKQPNYYTLQKTCTAGQMIFKAFIMFLITEFIGFTAIRSIKCILTKKLDLIVPVVTPGLDENTMQGYVILTTYHVVMIAFVCVGTIGLDGLFYNALLYIVSLAKLFDNEIIRLNKLLMSGEAKVEEIRYIVRNLVLMHKDFCNYIDLTQIVFNVNNTAQVASASFAVAVSIYNILIIKWMEAYLILVFSFTQLLTFCFLGTIVEVMTDSVYSSIISCKWYNLPIPQQKIFGVMMMRSQRPVMIFVFGVVPMNMQTFVSIMKTIYSMTMMLTEVTED